MTVFSPVFPALAQEAVVDTVENVEKPEIVQHPEKTADTPEPPRDPPEPGSMPDDSEQETDKQDGAPHEPAMFASTAPPAPLPTLATPSTIKMLKPEVDESSGALTYRFPLAIPPGRNGLQPELALTYNSQDRVDGSIVGYGWSLSIPSIARLNKTGSQNLYATNFFASSLDGELATSSGALYYAKTERGDLREYQPVGDGWVMYDKFGTQYTFGNTAASRQDNPGDASQVYRWMLSEIRDRNDNFISYTYEKIDGAIYPSTITYTGHGSVPGMFEISFARENRTDVRKDYRSAFEVETAERISQIVVHVNSAVTRTYALAYSAGQDGARSMLASITESGTDENGNTVSLPPTTFTYASQSARMSSSPSTWAAPFHVSSPSTGVLVADVNGDGLPDLLRSLQYPSPSPLQQDAYINTGAGWVSDPTWLPPPFAFASFNGPEYSVQAIDVNADGKVDLVKNLPWSKEAWLNNGAGWTLDANYSGFGNDFTQDPWQIDQGARLVDVNGDELPDWIRQNGGYTWLQLNTGSGWGATQSNPAHFNVPPQVGATAYGVVFADVNADGLVDILTGRAFAANEAFLNTGTGWVLDPGFSSPTNFIDSGNGDTGVRMVDLDNNGLPDLARRPIFSDVSWLDLGAGWSGTYSSTWNPGGSCNFINGALQNATRFADFNGDGLMDWFCTAGPNPIPSTYTVINAGTHNDLLTGVEFPLGGSSTFTYQATPLYLDASLARLNPALPYAITTVKTILNDDGFGTISSQTFEYEGGSYYYAGATERKFAGFHSITSTDAAGFSTTTWYHQGNGTDAALGEAADEMSKIGLPFRVEVEDAAGDLVRMIVNTWERVNLSACACSSFVQLAATVSLDYDGDADHADRAVSYTYDASSTNVLQKVEWGEVNAAADGSFSDVGSDMRTTAWLYAYNGPYHILGLPKQETLTDQSGAMMAQTKSYYDGLPLGAVTYGNLTKEERWKAGGVYIDVERTYNAYGFVTQELDPLNHATTFVPDTYNLYPATSTNALGQTTSFVYDYSIGKPSQTTDPNGGIIQTVFDGLDRVTEEKQSSATSASILETKTAYGYVPQAVGLRTQRTDWLDATISRIEYTYTDGFDRPIQTRRSMEAANNFAVTDTVYDTREYVWKQSLPYASTGVARTSATTTPALLSTLATDALGRTVNLATIVGNTSTVYDQWISTVTDPGRKVKGYGRDAYDRLVAVEEHNGAALYTTNYDYNARGDLVNLTDALGNVRAFTYDGLSRRLTAQDLHAPGDATFGVWVYAYDDAGNLSSTLDPKGQTIQHTYDVLNRPLTENFTGSAGIEVTYAYDVCQNGVGRLCSVTKTGFSESRQYDELGRITFQTRTIDGTPYTTTTTYDRQGNVLTILHPDGTSVTKTYNAMGKLESIVGVTANFDYGPHGEVVSQINEDGTTTASTYDASALYRLSQKVTTGYASSSSTPATITSTATFYPRASDGYVSKYHSVWNTAHDAASGSSVNYSSTGTNVVGTAKFSTNYYIHRSFLAFDTSSLPDDATVTGATLSVYPYSKYNQDNDGDDFITLVQGLQPSSTSLSTADFDMAGVVNSPIEGIDVSERKDLTSIATGSYLTFSLNATGLGWISPTLDTKLALREGHDVVDSPVASASTTIRNYLYFRPGEYAGTAYDPVLTVTYTQPSSVPSGPATPSILQDLSYTYDNAGNITQIIDASNTDSAKTTDYAYDDLYRLTSATVSGSADGNDGTITYAYDAIGNILSRSDRGTYTYGGSGYANPHAVTSILTPDGQTLTYAYDENGNLLGDGTSVHEWDYNNRLTSSSQASVASSPSTSTATATFYPSAGDGYVGKYHTSWNTAHDAVTGSTRNYSSTSMNVVGTAKLSANYYLYRSFLPFDTSSLPDNATVTGATLSVYPYSKINHDNDGDDFITVVQGAQASTTTLSTADFDTAGAVDAPIEGINASERKDLTSIATGSYLTFTLNSTGLGWISPTLHTKLALREGHDVIDSPITPLSTSTRNYLYIRPGEYTGTGYDPVLTVTYSYPSSPTPAPTIETSYVYDHEGQRVSKTSDAGTTYYPSSDYSVTDSTSTVYVSGPSVLVASMENDGSTTTTQTIHTDHLGSTSVVTDEDGVMVELLDYNPYGTERLSWSSSSADSEAESSKTYIGEYSDQETGLSYLNARYYDPDRGQFLSQDPVYLAVGDPNRVRQTTGLPMENVLADPQMLNSYSYARNNPILLRDTDGEWALPVVAIGAVAVWNAVVDPLLSAYSINKAIQDPTPQNVANATIDAGLTVNGIMPAGAGLLSDISKGTDVRKAVTKATDAVHSVYQSVKDGVVDYIGRTNNFLRRFNEHARSNNRFIDPVDGLNGLTKDQARGAEQYLLEMYGLQKNGGTLSNKINSVSPNSERYQNLLQQGKALYNKTIRK